jgi:uridine kinase
MIVIGVTGYSCSGKTTFSQMLKTALPDCLLISMDDYYKELTPEQYEILYDDNSDLNFDVPEAVNLDLLYDHLTYLKLGKPFKMPKFDCGKCVITDHEAIQPGQYKYVIVEGVMVFCKPEIVDICDLKIWINELETICSMRRLMKYTQDIQGYSYKYTMNQMAKFVLPGQQKYIKPCQHICDILINSQKMQLNLSIISEYLLNLPKKSKQNA